MGISTHVLDMAEGRPAIGVPVTLARESGGEWIEVLRSATDADGRCSSLTPPGAHAGPGCYRVRFETGAYFAVGGCLYPYVDIVFDVTDERHYHLPLLLTANGYTTYRGS